MRLRGQRSAAYYCSGAKTQRPGRFSDSYASTDVHTQGPPQRWRKFHGAFYWILLLSDTTKNRLRAVNNKLPRGARLTRWQRATVLKYIAADYSSGTVLLLLAKLNADGFPHREGDEPFPVISESALGYYRSKYREDLIRLRTERLEAAMISGCAVKAERIARLCQHADELEPLKWVVAESGKMWNEKAWRETLDDIAREMGERKPKDAVAGEQTIKVYVGINPERI